MWNNVVKKKSDGTLYSDNQLIRGERRSHLYDVGYYVLKSVPLLEAENPENDPFGVDLESKVRTNLQNKEPITVLTMVFILLKT
jgi:hypothetical protein